MNVILTKEAEFDFNESKYTAIPSSVFNTLITQSDLCTEHLDLPKVIMFNDKNEYIKNATKYSIDPDKDVYVSTKGQIFCFVKDNGATDTEENTGK